MTAVKAKRGDVVAVTFRTSWTTVRGERHEGEHVVMYAVAGITREGAVRTVRSLLHPDEKPTPIARLHGAGDRRIVPAATVDVDGLIDALHDRQAGTWDKAKFAGLDDCRAFVRPFRLETA